MLSGTTVWKLPTKKLFKKIQILNNTTTNN